MYVIKKMKKSKKSDCPALYIFENLIFFRNMFSRKAIIKIDKTNSQKRPSIQPIIVKFAFKILKGSINEIRIDKIPRIPVNIPK